MERFKRVAVGACAVLLAAGAQAALQDRDLDGNGETDAFYDTDLNITWLRDANVNGSMDWNSAMSWVEAHSFGGYTDWRLPTCDACAVDPAALGEMGYLWSIELGNPAGGPMLNTGDFQNLEPTAYWLSNEASPSAAWVFVASEGYSGVLNKLNSYPLAMAVRDGDVPAIPEPGTYALMLAGLAAFALAKRQRRR